MLHLEIAEIGSKVNAPHPPENEKSNSRNDFGKGSATVKMTFSNTAIGMEMLTLSAHFAAFYLEHDLLQGAFPLGDEDTGLLPARSRGWRG